MRFVSAMVLLLATTAPAAAQLPNPLTLTTDPADRAVMAEAASAVAGQPPDIARLDAVLAKLPRPTPLRGMVQTVRAGVLAAAKEAGPAVAALEEALRLLPDDPRPKLVATHIYTFSGAPQRAADLWMQASRESPDLARLSDRYVMMALVGRLTDIGDRAAADRISARLGEIGFSSALAPQRSTAALARTREAVRSQRRDDALQAVTAIGDPDDLLSLYVDRDYAMLWPRIEEWAGADLAAQSLRYLGELRGDWVAADSFETAAPYARRLANLDAHAAVIALFLPMFDRLQPGAPLDGAEFLAPVVARSLANLGRAADARALLAKVAATVPETDGGNALNIDGAYVTLAVMETDWPEVLARADAFMARATVLGTAINRSATVLVVAWRACALSRIGRAAEAEQAAAELLLGGLTIAEAAMQLHLCRGDSAAARALIITALEDERARGWALRFVQPARKAATPLARLTEPVAQAVRTAPEIVKAASRAGRVLPLAVNVTLPAGFDPFRVQPRRQPLGPDDI